MADIRDRWSSLGEDEQRQYVQQAADLKVQRKAGQLSSEMREIRKHLKQLKTEVSQLEELGVETAVLLHDGFSPQAFVQELSWRKASDFLRSTGTGNNFLFFFCRCSSKTCPSNSKLDSVKIMVRKVQDLFNQKYKEAGGTGRLPYKSLAANKIIIKVTGLPSDLPFRKPCLYGQQQLAAILQHGNDISFQIWCAPEEPNEELPQYHMCLDGQTPKFACNSAEGGPVTSAGRETAIEILEAVCVDGSKTSDCD
ncbi:uncharacterized protein [Hoplias malabaricus]|uniref:uncharacterized protein n=1 Tax=Hoplias malabaricus TaxID=27720 RepID=UPI0034622146